MKESSELKVRELQNKVEQKENELTSAKLDRVIEGQGNAESNALQRSNNAEAKAIERAEYAESTADSRAYDNECIQWRIERLWKKRLVLCNVGWAVSVILLVLFVVNKIQDANDRHVLAVQKVQEELQGVKSAYADGVDWFNSYAANLSSTEDIEMHSSAECLEEREFFASMIGSLPPEQKAVWYHFAAQLKKDEEATIRRIELENQKEMENYDGKGEATFLR